MFRMFSYVPYFSEGSYPLALGLQHRLEGDIPSSIDIKYEVYLLYLLGKQSLSMQHQLNGSPTFTSAIVHDELKYLRMGVEIRWVEKLEIKASHVFSSQPYLTHAGQGDLTIAFVCHRV